jgi:hypothetical protein
LSAARGKNDDAGAALVREGAQDYLLRGRPDPALLARAVRHIAACRSLASAAAESDARYQRLLASVTDYTYSVVVENGRAVSSRHGPGCAAVTGYASEEYEADPQLWYRMVLDADRPSVLEMASQVLAGGPAAAGTPHRPPRRQRPLGQEHAGPPVRQGGTPGLLRRAGLGHHRAEAGRAAAETRILL